MNIKEAKLYIEDSIKMYLKKDEDGEYRIPIERQRPIFLLGAPGIGKTAIMEQIAADLNIAIVSYSMTHHTRQSALGLPFIAHKEFDGVEYDVSEYTMSEIIASIYDVMRNSDIREGILFLDEINCVSETLAPSMLQFLQYKVFGRHKVPEGWVIVTAGNPPEYNKSVRDFDVVTLDRMKIMEVEADYSTWKEYAKAKELHPAIISFLDINKDYFYSVETTVKGKNYITARGWEDLSEMIKLYEESGLSVKQTLIEQYLRNDKVVREFSAYYDIYKKYQSIYNVNEILSGTINDSIYGKAKSAPLDERMSVMSMLINEVCHRIKENIFYSDVLRDCLVPLKAIKNDSEENNDVSVIVDKLIKITDARRESLLKLESSGALSTKVKKHNKLVINILSECVNVVKTKEYTSSKECFSDIKDIFDSKTALYKDSTVKVKEELHNAFMFVEKAFSDNGNEMLLLMTELTVIDECVIFITKYGSDDYNRHNQDMMLSNKSDDLLKRISDIDNL
ncbi:MAG: AAA family ATPase [Lachnospiraceae bacterium]|nr:AAA family ATPase [Lachnospiraceae bacterium]